MLGSVEMVTVCGKGHPLAAKGVVDCQQLAQHRQLLMSTESSIYPAAAGQPASLASRQFLRDGR